jgi:hypothetical protein
MTANSAESDDTAFIETIWTPEQQVAHMLDLCEAQMEAALSESDHAVEALIKAFAAISESAASDAANGQRSELQKHVASAIVAFQFYDKLTQRLGHVRYSLSTLAMFVCDRSQSTQRDKWRKLSTALKRLYKTEEERAIFDMVTAGASGTEAREQAQKQPKTTPASNIELF